MTKELVGQLFFFRQKFSKQSRYEGGHNYLFFVIYVALKSNPPFVSYLNCYYMRRYGQILRWLSMK